jgi:hypothetical protein
VMSSNSPRCVDVGMGCCKTSLVVGPLAVAVLLAQLNWISTSRFDHLPESLLPHR